MMNAVLIYVLVQATTNAMGLFFIYSTQSRVNEEILKRNYKLTEKNSLYSFSEGISNFFKGFIPFYYLGKGLSIIKDSGDFKNTVDKAIASGKYEPIDFQTRKTPVVPVEKEQDLKVEFEIVKEPFKARKIDSSIYNPHETPIEFIERVVSDDYLLSPTPYAESTLDIKEEVKEQEDTRANDLANYISNLPNDQLRALEESIRALRQTKEKAYTMKLEKEVA